MNVAELRLTDRQKLLVLLYRARRASARVLLDSLRGCEEMSLLRLPEGEP